MFCKKDRPSTNLSFLTAYHAARLAEFDYVHSSGVSIDTKSSVVIAGNFALIALLYTQENLSCLAYVALSIAVVNILLGIWAILVKNHQGPVADIHFKEDTRKGGEARVLLQLIEDTEHFTNENLKIIKTKRWIWLFQAILLAAAVVVICVDRII